MAIQYLCGHEERKNFIRYEMPEGRSVNNGIDYLEVMDEAQRILRVRFLKDLPGSALTVENVRIEGGSRIKNVQVTSLSIDGDFLTVTVDRAGDFSPYIVRLVQGPGSDAPPEWADPILSWIKFSFKVACPSDFDCREQVSCPPGPLPEPEIDYLAKDYGSFRRLMLDRLSVIMPQWKERNPADFGIAAVETMAYAADRLSYFQDAVATEAYLGTARRRVSVRRHARLLDYTMHDGCNARAWVVLEVTAGADTYRLRAHTPLLTGTEPPSDVRVSNTSVYARRLMRLEQFCLFALESICIQDQVRVHSGHIGADRKAASPGAAASDSSALTVDEESPGDRKETKKGGKDNDGPAGCEPGWSVMIGAGVHLTSEGTAVYGDRVKILTDSKVYDVYCNLFDNQGTIQGTVHKPLGLPVLTGLPDLPLISPGQDDIRVGEHGEHTLPAGSYGDVVLDGHATLRLSGGRYVFRSLRIGEHAQVLCDDASEVLVAGRLESGSQARLAPSGEAKATVGQNIVLYVAGGESANVEETASAVDIGKDNHITARIYAPRGLLSIGSGTNASGIFFGRAILVGSHAQISLPAGSAQETGDASAPGGRRIMVGTLGGEAQVFETMHEITLREHHNRIEFYTWGDEKCCLPRGATRASLDNAGNALGALDTGDLLLFEEVVGTNGRTEDADASHRHVVRLTKVTRVIDPVYDRQVLNIEWASEDALPFPLCLHVVDILVDPGDDRTVKGSVCVARGNVVLADHGRTLCNQTLVPQAVPQSGRYQPRLPSTDITFRAPFNDEQARSRPAGDMLRQDPRDAMADVELLGIDGPWSIRRDLLESDRFAPEFVVETESDGRAYLRFGDNVLGKRPSQGVAFQATFRVGNGTAGNVGAETITQIALAPGESDIQKAISLRNPLPAQGGTEPESIDEVKLYAPQAFRTQRRAVTPEDFVQMVQRHPEVQRAVGAQRWTGSWHTVFITVDRVGGRDVDDVFKRELRAFLEPYRLMGHDLEITAPRLVPLDIALRVCVAAEHQRVAVKATLQEVFGSGMQSDGRRGFFHPDEFTFGQHVYLSRVVAAAMQVPGVEWVARERFQRWGQPSSGEGQAGVIRMGGLEIARLDNDPNAPENGRIDFIMLGGL